MRVWQWYKRHGWLGGMVFIFALVAVTASAQDKPAVITADNISHLQSAIRLNFADLPEEVGQVDSGWFAVSADGETLAVMNRQNRVILWARRGGVLRVSQAGCPQADGSPLPGALVDGAFSPDGAWFAAVYLAGSNSYLHFVPVDSAQAETVWCDIPAVPLRAWADDQQQIWLELLPNDYTLPPSVQVYLLPAADLTGEMPVAALPSGPENDTESFARIGRIEPPLAITVTQAGLLKRWHLETGEVTATAQLDGLPGIGQVNYGGEDSGRYFVWVDSRSERLNLLDFATGGNREIVGLDGTSVPFLWLASSADAAIGVNVGTQSGVSAWELATGEMLDLGDYRLCRRPPDMVRLSQDGTTLVIGCDTGLDIWRISEGET